MKCTHCGQDHDFAFPVNLCPECEHVLFIQYDLERARNHISIRKLKNRRPGVWKYQELLPDIEESKRVTLGEGGTYLHKCERLAKEIGLKALYLKDETTNPTGSFLDRGMTIEVSAARKWNVGSVHNRSWHAGNMSASLVAYAARAGLRSKTFIGKRGNIDIGKFYQILAYAAEIEVVPDRAEALRRANEEERWSHSIRSTNPHFLEGTKTVLLETIEQLHWVSPEWILAPMGTGGLVSSIWKGIKELEAVGLSVADCPRIVGVQAAGCAPIVKALEKPSKSIAPVRTANTLALPIAMQNPLCGRSALEAITQSGGTGVTVTDNEILKAVILLAKLEGVFAEPASATTVAALAKMVRNSEIDGDETVVCVITGMGLKYPDIAKTLVKGKGNLEQLLTSMERRKVTTQLGHTKIQILRILSKGESYGYDIWKKLERVAGIGIKIPTVYQHLSDLESSGLIVRTRTSQVLKRKRRYYGISEKGKWTITQLEKL